MQECARFFVLEHIAAYLILRGAEWSEGTYFPPFVEYNFSDRQIDGYWMPINSITFC